ncbi:MAG: tetratricopeptide repeat protein [Haliea sp.]|nr:tetratricopeptide repeat protein [Haliea sp.]
MPALLLKSNLLQAKEDSSGAQEALERAAELEPDNPRVVVAFGELYLSRGDVDKARECALAALQRDAQLEDANILMGQVELRCGNLENAADSARFVIMHNPESAAALKLLADVKVRGNPVMGAWWRFNAFLSSLSRLKGVLVLICGYLFSTCFHWLSATLATRWRPRQLP